MSEVSTSPVVFMTREEYDAMHQTLTDIADGIPKIERLAKREFDRKRVAQAFEDAFELIGGVPRLAMWAHDNPSEFFKLYGRMLPTGAQIDLNANGEITFKHVLPPTKLDALEDQ